MKKEGNDKKAKLEEALRQNLLRRKASAKIPERINSNLVEGDNNKKELS